MPTPFTNQPCTIGSIWRHHEQGEFEIVGAGFAAETGDAFVMLRRVVRPAPDELISYSLSTFFGLDTTGGRRFIWIRDTACP